MSVSLKRKEKQNRIFRGSWRGSGRAVKSIVLRQVLPLTSLLLKHSIFVAGTQVYTQIQGASMGSQWAPILCSLVALHQESIFQKFAQSSLFHYPHFLQFRYVDNRVLLFPHSFRNDRGLDHFLTLDFFGAPIMLEDVSGYETLGFHVQPLQRNMSIVQPWDKTFRSSHSSSLMRVATSGIFARLRTIARHVHDPDVRLAQIQDLLGLVHQIDPILVAAVLRDRNTWKSIFGRNLSEDAFCWSG